MLARVKSILSSPSSPVRKTWDFFRRANELIDQRRIDGTRTRIGDKALVSASQISRMLIVEPYRHKGVNYNKRHYGREQIMAERAALAALKKQARKD